MDLGKAYDSRCDYGSGALWGLLPSFVRTDTLCLPLCVYRFAYASDSLPSPTLMSSILPVPMS